MQAIFNMDPLNTKKAIEKKRLKIARVKNELDQTLQQCEVWSAKPNEFYNWV